MFLRSVPRLSRAMSTRLFSSFIVSPSELSTALKNPGNRIIPLSAEWYLPNSPLNGHSEYLSRRIPGARFFDLDAVKDASSPYPHMLPDAATFSAAMGELGIKKDDTVVVYDGANMGLFSAPRVAWTLKVFGHENVKLLDNFKKWVEDGLPTESGDVKAWEKTSYGASKLDEGMVLDFEAVKKIAQEKLEGGAKKLQVLDARPNGRWAGKDPEPRPGLPSGHLPGSISVPFGELINPVTKSFKSEEELRKIFEAKGVDMTGETEKVLMCGTGVTAVVVDTAMELAGVQGKRRIYDGSWTEWAMRVDEKEGLIVKA
ncbi:putative thiosulfate sulfurtransferase [Pyronema domesticum]|uniref:Similar to Putative 3-mercaptopyruvate sulfurtransferase acc. no. Q9USJ1 n=1 Tax=Pyronema omphalodes (strain CBS 100304) TaxID=1076935 RepID=U4L2V4_PYROM|nr:putative thiosulfate sulfurtransferase [Pyronema domesticum]CCX10360.1 Similar to Putative 3-mercaptopyruvate sulfurtransferase; acc. no. Q9USJ1 [Pyronema omphalodes CBS 100304]